MKASVWQQLLQVEGAQERYRDCPIFHQIIDYLRAAVEAGDDEVEILGRLLVGFSRQYAERVLIETERLSLAGGAVRPVGFFPHTMIRPVRPPR